MAKKTDLSYGDRYDDEEEEESAVVAQEYVYDYGGLDAETKTTLKDIVVYVRVRQQAALEEQIAVGNKLRLARSLLGHGNFEEWAWAEFGLSMSNLFELRQIAERFSDHPEWVMVLTPTTARLLAPKLVPDAVIQSVVDLSKEWGRPLLVREVKEVRKQLAAKALPAPADNTDNATPWGSGIEQQEDADHYAVVLQGAVWVRIREATRQRSLTPYATVEDVDKLAVAIAAGLSGGEVPAGRAIIEQSVAPAALTFEKWLEQMPVSNDVADLASLLDVVRAKLWVARHYDGLQLPALNVLTHLEHLIEVIGKRVS